MIRYISFFVLIYIPINLSAQVDTLTVIENNEQIRVVLSSSNSTEQMQELKLLYTAKGFFDAQITLLDTVYTVQTGSRFTISELKFCYEDGTSFINRDLSDIEYSTDQIEKKVEYYYEELVDQGFRNAVLGIETLELDTLSKTVSIAISVDKGELVTISSILFTGNRINSQNYLTKVSRIPDSLVANKENLNQIRQSLLSSELFDQVSEPQIFEDEGESILVFAVQEKALNTLDGLIGYVPNASEKGQIVGDLDISLWNVFRDGNSFELMYQRLKPETSRIKLAVSQDWIANIPLSLGIDFSLYQNDTTYQTRNIGLNSSYWMASNFKIKGRVYSTKSNSSRETGFELEPDGQKQGSELGFTYTSLDRIEVPKRGIKIDLMYGIASKDIENDSSVAFRQQRLETHVNTYLPLLRNSVIATSINGFYVIGDEFTESDLMRFGGANSFRGYAEEQFLASELLWGDIEYRFLTDRNSYLFLFSAVGVYKRPQLYSEVDNSFVQKDFLYSGGFGLSYKTAIGRLKFSYALSSTETLGNGKIHFGIRTSF